MNRVTELRAKKADFIDKMNELLELCETEERDLTEEEENSYTEFDAEVGKLNSQIQRAEKLEIEKADVEAIDKPAARNIPTSVEVGKDLAEDKPFRNSGEYMYTVLHNPSDPRLRKGVADKEDRVHQMKNGTSGGFNIPDQFSPNLLSVEPQEAIVRPRANVIPAGSPPDAPFKVPALNQGAGSNMTGGIIVTHGSESAQITESTADFEQIELIPKKINAYVTASNEMLNNWDAASAFFDKNMRLAMISASEIDYLSGDGVNKALGIFNCPATILQTRTTANQIAYADVLNMFSRTRMVGTGNLAWVTSQTTIPQLGTIVDAGNNNLWVQSAGPGLPPTLLGIPVLFYERSPALGITGDLLLGDFGGYMIKDGSGPNVAVSEHIRFQNDEVAFRLTWRTDGQAELREPILLEGATTNTVSNFVALSS